MPPPSEPQAGTNGSDYEKLFLLEVLVVNVYIDGSSLQLEKEVISNFKETCVLFQFLNYPPLVVCEEDFCVYGKQSSPPDSRLIFKSGKSCLFSLRTLKSPIMPMDFDINISVAKKLREGVLPNKLVIGKANVNLGGSFTRLMTENANKTCTEQPTPKITRDTFDLFDDKKNKVGDITVFIRLSCFGELIITQFQLGPDQKEFYFKGTDTKAVCMQPEQQKQAIEAYKESPTMPQQQYGDQPPSAFQRPSNGYGNEAPKRGSKLPPEYSQPKPSMDDYEGSYKVGRDERIQEDRWQRQQERKPYYKEKCQDYMRYDDGEKSRKAQPLPPLCPFAPKLNLCECDYPIPSEILPRCPQYSQRDRKKGKGNGSKDSFDLPPGGVGVRGDQVIFQMHKPGEIATEKEKKMASSLLYKVGAVEGNKESPKQIVQILPQPPDEIPSPSDKEDVFILKIGKQVEGLEGKSNFEVELRTPKMKDPKPETNNQETQYLESDVVVEKAGKKGKGGKKDKGKGKGKKKK